MSSSGPIVQVYSGAAVREVIADHAALRIAVFREFPYLYEGSLANEERYLQTYANSPQSTVVIARDGKNIVGASTAMPLSAHSDDVVPPLTAAGYQASQVFYFGESVLLPEYRGLGLGHRFFDEREAAARGYGFSVAAFCAVVRPVDHPLRPTSYVPHDAFWTKRGYQKRPDIVAKFDWLDVGEQRKTVKAMEFWLRELT